ncbi:MAG: glycosyltransferase [Planctomycetota bacterium]
MDPERLRGLRARRAGEPLTLGYLGSIAQHKGLHVLIDAFTRVLGPLRLRIHGREEDYPDYARDRRYQASRDPRISFHGAFKTDELGQVLSDIDVLVVPSLWFENTPFVMLEAIAAQKPVIASNLGGLSELCAGGRGGATFPAGDAAALAAIIARLLQSPGELEQWRAGLPEVKTLARNYGELRALYEELQPQAMNEPESDPRASDAPTVADLQAALAQRERELRDLYDIVAQMAARLLREPK